MIEIDRREWRFVALLSFIVIAVTFLPLLFGFYVTPEDSVFLGTQRVNAGDTPVYYAWIEQAKAGHLLFKNQFTPEEQIRFIFDPFWLGVGLFAKLFSLSSLAAYQLAKIFLIPVFLAIAYIFISYFFEKTIKRKICFIFFIFSAGVGGYVALGTEAGLFHLKPPPMDLWVAEATTFFTLYHTPHFIASILFILLTFLLILKSFEKQKIIYSFLAGTSSLFLFQFHPYYVPTILGVIGAYIAVQSLRSSKIRLDLAKHFLILILVSAPAIIYHFWTLNKFYIKQQHAIQNELLTPPFYNFLLTYGFLFILSLIGVIFLLRQKEKTDKEIFLLSWWGANLFLVYAPFLNFQRRLIESMPMILTITAILGLFYLRDILKNKNILQKSFLRKPWILIIIFGVLFTFSNYYLLILDINFYATHNPFAFLKKDRKEAMLWLKQNTPEESVILSTYENSYLIPAFAQRAVYFGHWGPTADAANKMMRLKWFFEISTCETRGIFLKNNKIDYLFFMQGEQTTAILDPAQDDYLEKIYQNSEVTIYRVKNQ